MSLYYWRVGGNFNNIYHMDIKISYSSSTNLTEEEINCIISVSQKFGQVSVDKWSTRNGAIDLAIALEIIFGIPIVQAVMKPVIEGYLKGLIGESYFKGIGERHQTMLKDEVVQIKNYLTAFYDVFIAKKVEKERTIAIVVYIDDCQLYVTLDSYRTSQILIDSLAEALVNTFALISLKLIEVEEPKVIQLYPDFDNQKWDYLFIPTVKAFGNFIDKYYRFSENKIYYIENAIEFIDKFKITNMDSFKLIITPRQ